MMISVEQGSCVGTNACQDSAPKYFGQDEDGIVTLLQLVVDEADTTLVEAAVRVCPVTAIHAEVSL